VLVAVEAITPDALQQFGTAEGSARVLQQKVQQIELAQRQGQCLSSAIASNAEATQLA
jgi:hypothetical protein